MNLSVSIADAAFAVPFCDGSFEPDFADYLGDLAGLRRSVVLAFAPKAAGTYLRSAVIAAINGQLVRTVHAQGGRDASFYLPTFLKYFAANQPARTLVTHVHMQALPANRHVIEALDLKPVIMIRSIPDMLTSYADMLRADPLSPDNWLNIRIPDDYASRRPEQQGDFLIEMMAPWYVSYFSTWMDYAAREARVLVLQFDAFRAAPAATLHAILVHSGLPRAPGECRRALEAAWEDRRDNRFNKGVSGRGATRFTPGQIARLHRMLDHYPDLAPLRDALIPPP